MAEQTVLVVDDENSIRDMVRTALEFAGFDCLEAEDGQHAHALIVDKRPDLVLLDWMMPGISGIELVRRLRRDESTVNLPVIMLTAKADEDNKIQGLDVGADDYLIKPFSPRELIARIRAVLRRSDPMSEKQVVSFSGLELDMSSRRVYCDSEPVEMGPTEYRMLEFFMTHPERAYTRGQLLDYVWGANVYVEDRTVDVHIRRLRRALEPSGYDRFIQTVRGTGYRFSEK